MTKKVTLFQKGNISLPDTVFWKTDGCVTKINDSVVECICNHATPFAVLLVIYSYQIH